MSISKTLQALLAPVTLDGTPTVTMEAATRFLKMMTLGGSRNGVPYQWAMASRNRKPKYATNDTLTPDAVHIVARVMVEDVPHLLFTREYRHTIQTMDLGFPAGLVESDGVEASALRELHEECGMTATNIVHVSQVQTASSGMTDETYVTFYVDAVGTPNSEHLETGEEIDSYLLTQQDVQDYLEMPQQFPIDRCTDQVLSLFAKTGCIHPNQL